LHVFTNANLKKIWDSPSKYIQKTQLPTANKSMMLLTPDLLGSEEELDLDEWSESYANWFRFIKAGSLFEPEILERWVEHRDRLAAHPDKREIFPAIRAFDISERMGYWTRQFEHDEHAWLRGLDNAVATFRYENPKNANVGNQKQSGEGKKSANQRYQPYPSSDNRPSRDSFQNGRQSSTPRGVCIICGRPGHPARACRATKTASGKALITKTDADKPSVLSGIGGHAKDEFCVPFNIAGHCRGEHTGAVRHACSICGSDQHHASAGKC
ncbi:hypothetical protein FA95DRAFT_1473146, partial [Auriscalpium vulgare]